MGSFVKNRQYYKFCMYGFLKNLRFFDAFLILFLVDAGISFTQIGILYAAREVFINVFEIPSGFIADTYGRRNSLAGSLLAYIASFVIFYLGSSFWIFLPGFLLYGAGDAFRTGTHKGMIMEYLELNGWEDQKIIYYGHTRSWSQRGSAISALVAGVIVFFSGSYREIFLFSVIPYVINFFIIISYPKDLNRSPGQEGKRQGLRLTIRSFLGIIRRRNVFGLIYTSAFHSAYLQAVKDYIQLVMFQIALLIPFFLDAGEEKKNGVVIGILYFFIYLATSMASRRSSRVAERAWRNIPLLTLLLGFGLGVLSGILYIRGLWILTLVTFAGIYVVENVRKPILTGYIAEQASSHILVSVISAQSVLKTMMTALLALALGFITDRAGVGISLLSISSFLLAGTILINIPRRNGL